MCFQCVSTAAWMEKVALASWKGGGPTRMELGCKERAALFVDSTVPSAAVTDGTACMPPGANAAAG